MKIWLITGCSSGLGRGIAEAAPKTWRKCSGYGQKCRKNRRTGKKISVSDTAPGTGSERQGKYAKCCGMYEKSFRRDRRAGQ